MTDEGPSESWRQFKYHRNMSTKLRSFGKLESADLQWRKAVESVEGIFYKKRTIFSQEFSAVCDDYKFIKMSPFAICKTKTAIDPNKMPHHFEWKIVDKFTEHEGSYKSSSYPSEHSIQYQDLDPNFSLNFTPFNGIDGDGLRLGFVEIIDAQFFNYSKDCLNDSWVLYPVKEYHRYFDYIYDSNPSPYFKVSYSNPPVVPLNNEFSIHATQTTGVTISYDDSNGDYRILPSASFFIDNGLPKIGSPFCSKNDLDYKEGATFEYFAENNVRLVNRSLKFPSNAQISRIYDWFARRYDQLHTVASGNAANQTTWCNSHNAICVGGYLDEDDGNVNTSNDKLDDTHYDSYSSVNVSNSDREEPDVVAPYNASTISTNDIADNLYQEEAGTSLSAPLTLAMMGLQLEQMRGDWRECRISEYMRASAKLWAGKHKVDGHAVSYHADHPEHVGDSHIGWGIPSRDADITAGRITCKPPEKQGGTRRTPCQKGTYCDGLPSTSVGDVDPPFTPPSTTPNGAGVASGGRRMASFGDMERGQMIRGVLSWSSCPYSSHVDINTFPKRPNFSSSPFLNEVSTVNFNIGIYHIEQDHFEWLSYSLHDSMEAFEFVLPEDGSYEIWRFADRDQWGCSGPYRIPGPTDLEGAGVDDEVYSQSTYDPLWNGEYEVFLFYVENLP